MVWSIKDSAQSAAWCHRRPSTRELAMNTITWILERLLANETLLNLICQDISRSLLIHLQSQPNACLVCPRWFRRSLHCFRRPFWCLCWRHCKKGCSESPQACFQRVRSAPAPLVYQRFPATVRRRTQHRSLLPGSSKVRVGCPRHSHFSRSRRVSQASYHRRHRSWWSIGAQRITQSAFGAPRSPRKASRFYSLRW